MNTTELKIYLKSNLTSNSKLDNNVLNYIIPYSILLQEREREGERMGIIDSNASCAYENAVLKSRCTIRTMRNPLNTFQCENEASSDKLARLDRGNRIDCI